MPANQHGTVDHRKDRGWRVRWYDEKGERRSRSGFATKSEAREFLQRQVDEIAALRRGDLGAVRRRELPTLNELADEYLAQHVCEPNTMATLTARMKKVRTTFGETRVDRLAIADIRGWRTTLPERSAHYYVKVLRQLLHYAVAVGLIDVNPATKIPNPTPKHREVPFFGSLAEVEAVAAEMIRPYQAIPIFVALTGLRPSEWLALERRDIEDDVVHIRRVYTDRTLKPYGKQAGSLRSVPIPLRAQEALSELPPRLDTKLLFPSIRTSGWIEFNHWRRSHWAPAVRAAGLEHRSPYALRHTYASFAIAGGVSLFELARFMGTSVAMLDRTYGHLLPDALDRTRRALDAFLVDASAATGQ